MWHGHSPWKTTRPPALLMDEAVSMACCPQDEKAGISLLEMSVAFMATIGQWLPVLRKDATGDQWVTVPTTVGGAQALSNLD